VKKGKVVFLCQCGKEEGTKTVNVRDGYIRSTVVQQNARVLGCPGGQGKVRGGHSAKKLTQSGRLLIKKSGEGGSLLHGRREEIADHLPLKHHGWASSLRVSV